MRAMRHKRESSEIMLGLKTSHKALYFYVENKRKELELSQYSRYNIQVQTQLTCRDISKEVNMDYKNVYKSLKELKERGLISTIIDKHKLIILL